MNLSDPDIIYILEKRLKNNDIYTFVGDIVIAMNPFKRLPIYTDEILRSYDGTVSVRCVPWSRSAFTIHLRVCRLSDIMRKALICQIRTFSSPRLDVCVKASCGNSSELVLQRIMHCTS